MPTDTERLDWLEQQLVDVRDPLRYGSRAMFIANPTQHDAEADYDSPLRAEIDKRMALENSTEQAKPLASRRGRATRLSPKAVHRKDTRQRKP